MSVEVERLVVGRVGMLDQEAGSTAASSALESSPGVAGALCSVWHLMGPRERVEGGTACMQSSPRRQRFEDGNAEANFSACSTRLRFGQVGSWPIQASGRRGVLSASSKSWGGVGDFCWGKGSDTDHFTFQLASKELWNE